MRLLLLALLGVLAACAAAPVGSPAASPTGSQASPDELLVQIDRGSGAPVERYTLRCGTPGAGDHPDGPAACAHLAGLEEPFVPVPDDAVCTEVYGGPQTAHVTGTWRGRPVDLRLSRVDGCRIAQWDGLGALLPGPVGEAPPS